MVILWKNPMENAALQRWFVRTVLALVVGVLAPGPPSLRRSAKNSSSAALCNEAKLLCSPYFPANR